MAKDPAFLFYPGDYLRDTQCLSEPAQTAYDRIMCEHMRNICISQEQLNFFTKRLTPDQKSEVLMVLTKVSGGYQIGWVAESIEKRRNYSESRRKNREGKPKEKKKTSSSYVKHMENENENVNEYVTVGGEIVNHETAIEFFEAQLNGTQKEYSLPGWRPLIPKWFAEHIHEDFADTTHLKNSFKKWYIKQQTTNGKPKTQLFDLSKI